MKKQAMIIGLLVVLFLMSGCKSPATSSTTGKITKDITTDICDDLCQQEKDDYIKSVNSLLAQAQGITVKINDWKSVTKKDLADITSLKDQVSVLKIPQDFEMIHDYYLRAFNHYVEAVNYVVIANEKYASFSNSLNAELRNEMLTSVLNRIQEARKIIVYADEEAKFATHIVSKT